MAKAMSESRGVYKVCAAQNDLIRVDDDFRGRLTDDDWALFLGHAEYLVLRVHGYQVRGLPNFRFHAKPIGVAIRWHPTEREVGLLLAGQTIEAPVDLTTLLPSTPATPSALMHPRTPLMHDAGTS
jgi:hypothetical protein